MQPNPNAIVIEAVPIEPINECPTCKQPRVLRDHVIRPTRLLDVATERSANAFANIAE
ncbi:hypothetical protein NY035_07645 [Corynebacterium diphtheriae bv. mitis]|uniref:hypothetical protein n=1 Tax=Corynebacterium diphtheriae TaxID=1717 RepID=UPI0018CB08C9|nr:hypothetical protein [Corynebacterium diphtheriae]MBG9358895.1 hypothetical protein [Corynebacterium diphtheriae bv. mitis]MBG9363496.1 hypothetical protein [Corynebacterium diphtheriae bv. mitis]UWE83758.1 hypothetical protein NY053_10985 [Corynebacterium diphtheriae bv. mitis]UWE91964.1 hypothetical protein NY044_10950 [Corynebacterium diphtheriae bv. mitis]UWE96068.1 hypothetical protein NY039_09675 [Corynebacterium diphtheriae bv. mitis]